MCRWKASPALLWGDISGPPVFLHQRCQQRLAQKRMPGIAIVGAKFSLLSMLASSDRDRGFYIDYLLFMASGLYLPVILINVAGRAACERCLHVPV
jgi:hypothetical protein